MFDGLVPKLEPTAKELEEQANAALYNKKVNFEGAQVKTYDLSKPKDVTAYKKDLESIFKGIQARTHLILCNQRNFVTNDKESKWLVHLEWIEFSLSVTANATVGT